MGWLDSGKGVPSRYHKVGVEVGVGVGVGVNVGVGVGVRVGEGVGVTVWVLAGVEVLVGELETGCNLKHNSSKIPVGTLEQPDDIATNARTMEKYATFLHMVAGFDRLFELSIFIRIRSLDQL